jgi:hypothetical protein
MAFCSLVSIFAAIPVVSCLVEHAAQPPLHRSGLMSAAVSRPAAATEQSPNCGLTLASSAYRTRSSLAADTCQVSSSGRVYQVCTSSTS